VGVAENIEAGHMSGKNGLRNEKSTKREGISPKIKPSVDDGF